MKKELYKAPTSRVVEMKMQGMLCESGGSGSLFLLDLSDYANGGDPFAAQ